MRDEYFQPLHKALHTLNVDSCLFAIGTPTMRSRLTARLKNFYVRMFWEDEFSELSQSRKQTDTQALTNRLNKFLANPLVLNILGQSKTTIDFRRAIEQHKIILIKLPVKTLKHDAGLLGMMLLAEIHAATFSFADTPLNRRPSFTLVADEFQHFATSDFAELFTEGRKYGSRVVVAHQFRNQVPDMLRSATMTARTKVTFQLTHEDASELGHVYIGSEPTLRKEDLERDVVKHLLSRGHSDAKVLSFVNTYLRKLDALVKTDEAVRMALYGTLNSVLYRVMQENTTLFDLPVPMIQTFGSVLGFSIAPGIVGLMGKPDHFWKKESWLPFFLELISFKKEIDEFVARFPTIWSHEWDSVRSNPRHEKHSLYRAAYLDKEMIIETSSGRTSMRDVNRHLLFDALANMLLEQADLQGKRELAWSIGVDAQIGDISYFSSPSPENAAIYSTPESFKTYVLKQLQGIRYSLTPAFSGCYDFIYSLRYAMNGIYYEPIGEKRIASPSEMARTINNLPKRAALVRIGQEIATITTLDTPETLVSGYSLSQRVKQVQAQTRATYCRSRLDVEKEIYRRHKLNVSGVEPQQDDGASPPHDGQAKRKTTRHSQSSAAPEPTQEQDRPTRRRRGREVDDDE